MSPSNMSVGLLLNEKEQEVARLREQALTSLEAKVDNLAIIAGRKVHFMPDSDRTEPRAAVT